MENLKTFDEWSKLGFKIKKGSKAKYIECIPMFSHTQVEHIFAFSSDQVKNAKLKKSRFGDIPRNYGKTNDSPDPQYESPYKSNRQYDGFEIGGPSSGPDYDENDRGGTN